MRFLPSPVRPGTASDGGTLRIFPDVEGASDAEAVSQSPLAEVEPRAGTLVLFWSHRMPHEVLPAAAPRFALSLWMCTATDQPDGWMPRPSATAARK